MRLIDADALLEALGDGPISWTDTPEEIQAVNDWREFVSIINDAPTVDWISVNERLPEDGQFVVVRHEVKGRIYSEVANYIADLWWLDWNSNGLELNAISWVPLPEPPDVVSKNG